MKRPGLTEAMRKMLENVRAGVWFCEGFARTHVPIHLASDAYDAIRISLSDAGTAALNNIRAASGSPEWRP